MEPFKAYVTCITAFFIPLTCLTLCQLYPISSPALLTKNNKQWNERNENENESFSCCFLQYCQSFMRNQEENIELQKKYIEEFV